MKIRLALYDPSHVEAGSYWTWRDEMLPLSVLDGFYYDIASKRRPEKPNMMRGDDFVGGMVKMENGWMAGYRFFDGGRDTRNRPGRFILLAALWQHPELSLDIVSLLEGPIFEVIKITAATTSPVPAPARLTVEYPETTIRSSNEESIDKLAQVGTITLASENAFRQAESLFASLSQCQIAIVDLKRENGEQRAVISLPQKSIAPKASRVDKNRKIRMPSISTNPQEIISGKGFSFRRLVAHQPVVTTGIAFLLGFLVATMMFYITPELISRIESIRSNKERAIETVPSPTVENNDTREKVRIEES